MADFTMGNGTFYRNGVNFGECDVLTTHSREFDVLTSHSLTSHFIGETSVQYLSDIRPLFEGVIWPHKRYGVINGRGNVTLYLMSTALIK